MFWSLLGDRIFCLWAFNQTRLSESLRLWIKTVGTFDWLSLQWRCRDVALATLLRRRTAMLHGHIVFDVTATSMILLMSVTLGFRKSHQGRSWDIAATLQVRPMCDIAVRRRCDVEKCNHLWSLMGRSDVAATLTEVAATWNFLLGVYKVRKTAKNNNNIA